MNFQDKLAEKIGISRQAVAKWEVGQSYPDVDKLIILSDLFRISIDKLIKDYDDENCSYEYTKQLHYTNEKEIDFLCRAKKSSYICLYFKYYQDNKYKKRGY